MSIDYGQPSKVEIEKACAISMNKAHCWVHWQPSKTGDILREEISFDRC